MKSYIIGIVVALVAIAGIGAVVMTQSEDSQPNEASSQTQAQTQNPETNQNDQATNLESSDTERMRKIEIKNSAYAPSKVTVKKGTTVTWTNRDSIQHDISPDNPTDEFKQSDLLSKNESYSVTFNTVGTYTYFCTPHPFMKGTVEVIE